MMEGYEHRLSVSSHGLGPCGGRINAFALNANQKIDIHSTACLSPGHGILGRPGLMVRVI